MEAKMTWRQLKEHWKALGYTAESFSMVARKELPGWRGLSEPALSRNLKERPEGLVPEAVANWALTRLEPAPGGKRPEAVEPTKAPPAGPEPKEPQAAPASAEPVEAAKAPAEPTKAPTANLPAETAPAPATQPPRRQWKAFVAGAGTAAAAMLLVLALFVREPSRIVVQHEVDRFLCLALLDSLLSQAKREWPGYMDASAVAMGERRLMVPNYPVKGQKVPPCDPEAAQRAINGGCWIKIADTPPCPKKTGEYEGGCYIPVAADPKVPVSIDGSDGKAE